MLNKFSAKIHILTIKNQAFSQIECFKSMTEIRIKMIDKSESNYIKAKKPVGLTGFNMILF